MLSFTSDYIAGAHPRVLQRLIDTNLESLSGYGSDPYCRSAADKIRKAFGCPDADVFLLAGGTQTNQTVISTVLQPWEGVIAAETGHVAAHEAGAIEFTGHKVITLRGKQGKLDAADVEKLVATFYADENHEHMVYPGMVYISFPTEYGTIYSRKELQALSRVCRKYGMVLYADGARLGYGLCSLQNELTPQEFAELCDVFYVGGTKVGALCGEAVVFPHGNAPKHMLTQIKRHGALLAKGRLLGVQFDALFTDDLYFEISRYVIRMTGLLTEVLEEKRIPFFLKSPTNQQFVILENERIEQLKASVNFEFWETLDAEHTVVRFAAGWSTTEADIEALKALL